MALWETADPIALHKQCLALLHRDLQVHGSLIRNWLDKELHSEEVHLSNFLDEEELRPSVGLEEKLHLSVGLEEELHSSVGLECEEELHPSVGLEEEEELRPSVGLEDCCWRNYHRQSTQI